jgi:catalase
VDGEIVRCAYTRRRDDDDFVQARALWEKVLSETDRQHMIDNLVAHLKASVRPDIIDRVLDYWRKVHPQLSGGVGKGLGVPVKTAAA